MRRRRKDGPVLDMVDVLNVRRSNRRDEQARLVAMADQYGFPSVAAMVAEADRIHASWTAERDAD